MKKIYWLFPLVCTACASNQKDTPLTPEQQIAGWDAGMQYHIDTLQRESDTQEVPDGGMETTFYTMNGKLMKVKEEVGLSWGRLTSIFYCVGDTLRGFSELHERFPISADSLTHDRLETNYSGSLLFRADTVFAEHHQGEKLFAGNAESFGARILEEFRDHLVEFKELKK